MNFHVRMISKHEAIVFITGKHRRGIINQHGIPLLPIRILKMHGINRSGIGNYSVRIFLQSFRPIHIKIKGPVKIPIFRFCEFVQRKSIYSSFFTIFPVSIICPKLCPMMIRSEIDILLSMFVKRGENVYRVNLLIHQTISIGNGLIHTGRSQLFLCFRIQKHTERIGNHYGTDFQIRIKTLHRI